MVVGLIITALSLLMALLAKALGMRLAMSE